MSIKMTKKEYEKLIKEDILWLLGQEYSLEMKHIRDVLEWSVGFLYPESKQNTEYEECDICKTNIPIIDRYEKAADVDDSFFEPCASCKNRETDCFDMPCNWCSSYGEGLDNELKGRSI